MLCLPGSDLLGSRIRAHYAKPEPVAEAPPDPAAVAARIELIAARKSQYQRRRARYKSPIICHNDLIWGVLAVQPFEVRTHSLHAYLHHLLHIRLLWSQAPSYGCIHSPELERTTVTSEVRHSPHSGDAETASATP